MTKDEFKPVKSVSPQPVQVGENITYTVTLMNTCESSLINARFQDILPEGLEFVEESVIINGAPNVTVNPKERFTVPNILGGGKTMIKYEANVSGTSSSTIDNSTSMNYDYTPVQDSSNNGHLAKINNGRIEATNFVDLSITKTAQPFVVPGGVVNYTLDVQNLSLTTATNVVVTDNIPSELSNVEYSLNNGTTWNNWMGSLNLGTVQGGDMQTILLRGTVADDVTDTVMNTAIVRSTEPDSNPNNNTSTTTISVGNLGLAKTASIVNGAVGDTYTYTLSITNPDTTAISTIDVIDTLPANLIYQNNLAQDGISVNGDITRGITISTIPAGGTVNLTFDVKIASEPANGQIVNKFNASYDGITYTSPENVVTIAVNNPAIRITKVASTNPVIPGVPYNYIITVTNIGNAILNNVKVTDGIFGNVCILRTWINGRKVKYNLEKGVNIGTLAMGASVVIIVEVVIKDTEPLCNNIEDMCEYEDECGYEEKCENTWESGASIPRVLPSAPPSVFPPVFLPIFTNIATVQAIAYVGITPVVVTDTAVSSVNIRIVNPCIDIVKYVDRDHLEVGDVATFTIQVINKGDIMLNNVMIYDQLPKEMEIIYGSTRINGIPGHKLNVEKGIYLNTLAVGQVVISHLK
ncbi:hypothetical protein [Cellulosilyticum ruminicola]|uniref:hypothetical protein n=1 Tax=Cellulosilyticum ruminicola TaxID=425254 RepID=UPI00241D801D|nr:hypothetical protein [Cellulosilyticum ruminicola]